MLLPIDDVTSPQKQLQSLQILKRKNAPFKLQQVQLPSLQCSSCCDNVMQSFSLILQCYECNIVLVLQF